MCPAKIKTIVAGSATSALKIGGQPDVATTEEFTAADFEIKSVTTS